MEDIKELQRKIFELSLEQGFTVANIVEIEGKFTDEEQEYATSNIILKVEDLNDKEKAIANILNLLGQANLKKLFVEDEEEGSDELIKILNDILVYIQG